MVTLYDLKMTLDRIGSVIGKLGIANNLSMQGFSVIEQEEVSVILNMSLYKCHVLI